MSKRKKTARSAPKRKASGSPVVSTATTSKGSPVATLDSLLLALCIGGIGLTGYLSYVALFETHPLYCGVGSGCDLVQSSRWSTLLGMPMAVWGLATYAILARLVWRRRSKPATWQSAFFVALCAFSISLYLTTVSVVEIEATCGYCLASFALISAILALVGLRKPSDAAQFPWGRSVATPFASVILLLTALHLHYSGLLDPAFGPEKPAIKALAMHLDDTGAKFYGAYWCPRCQEQKALFEASGDRLPYVECSPNGRQGGQSAACALENINDYPTWIIEGRRYPGRLTLQELTRYSRFTHSDAGFDGGSG